MRTFEIEIVAGTVQVDHKKVDAVEAVLLAIGLRLGDHHLLGETVRRVGFLRIAVPEVAFLEGHGRELGVRANGADGQKLLDASLTAQLDELGAHEQIGVQKRSGIETIGADAADHGGEMQYDFRLMASQQSADVGGLAQVVLGAARDDDLIAAGFAQAGDHMASEKAGAAGHENSLILKIHRSSPSMRSPRKAGAESWRAWNRAAS